MSSKTVKQGQSFLDKVTQLTGSWENALLESMQNNISVTDDLPIGLDVEVSLITNKRVAGFFNAFNEPATAYNEPPSSEKTGIGYMKIGDTFIVG